MKITWLGHAAFLIEGKKKILIDPFLEGNPMAAVKPEEVETDIICITHAHGDHIGDSEKIAKKCGAKIVSTYEIASLFQEKGIEAIGMNIGGTVDIDGVKISMVSAAHTSCLPEDPKGYGGVATGFVIEAEEGKRVYHAGDTGLTSEFLIIGEYYSPTVALLPIGGHFTMGIDEAVYAIGMIKPKHVIPMHYNTFPVINVDPEEFKEKVERKYRYVKVHVLKPGESVEI